MIGFALCAILSTAMFYLGSRALITQAIWEHYPPTFARFMDCPACTGFWWGVFWSAVLQIDLEPLAHQPAVIEPIVSGLCMLVLVPILAGVMQWGLDQAGSAVADK